MPRHLPNDYARCLGLVIEDPNDEDNAEWVESCKNCLRRTSPRVGTDYGSWFDPPVSFAEDCPERIPG